MVASRNLRENAKFSVKVVDNHTYFQNRDDESSTVLKHDENRPIHWMRTPTASDVSYFEEIIKEFEQSARKVRIKVAGDWLEEEKNSCGDLVTRLQFLRNSREEGDIWPCYNCRSVG